MADIKLVIKIPEEEYRWIKESDKTVFADVASKECMLHAIKTGTPLPKGHGRLGDLDKIKKEMRNYNDDCAKTSEYTRLGFETAMAVVGDAPTIIEAESEAEDLANLDSMLEDLWNATEEDHRKYSEDKTKKEWEIYNKYCISCRHEYTDVTSDPCKSCKCGNKHEIQQSDKNKRYISVSA